MARKWLTALFSILAVMPLAAEEAAPKDGPPNSPVWAAISVTYPLLDVKAGDSQKFQICFSLVNDGEKPFKLEPWNTWLMVNGKKFAGWPGSTYSGLGDAGWESMGKGKYAQFRVNLGRFFTEPGEYRVRWEGNGFRSSEAVFRVLNQK